MQGKPTPQMQHASLNIFENQSETARQSPTTNYEKLEIAMKYLVLFVNTLGRLRCVRTVMPVPDRRLHFMRVTVLVSNK